MIGGDVVTMSGGTYGSADAGMNIPISGATVGGVDAGNYAVTVGAISGAITARTITAIDGVTVVSRTVDGSTAASFDTTQATGTGVLASELADFRAGGLVVKEFLTADAGLHDVSVSYTLANSGTFKAGNYELGGGVGTGTLPLPPSPPQPSPLQMEIGVNEERIGALTDPLTSDDDPMDLWTLRGEPGTELHVDMVTDGFDAVLYAVGDEIELWDDDSGGGTNARLELTLPPSGEVIIIASAFDSSSRGQYVLRTRTAAAADDEAYERARAENTMESYAAYLRDFPNGRYATEALAVVTAMAPTIGVNEERIGALTDPLTSDDDPMDVWTLRGEPGTELHVDMVTDEFDAVLYAMGVDIELVDDDSGGGSNARLELTLPPSGEVIIIASAFDSSSRGQYVLRTGAATLQPSPPQPSPLQMEIGVNEERIGALTDPLTSDDDPMDLWTLRGEPGTELHVDMVTDGFDAVLYAVGDEIELWDDDSGGGTNARLELTLPPSGEVVIIASAFDSSSRGQYSPADEDGGCRGRRGLRARPCRKHNGVIRGVLEGLPERAVRDCSIGRGHCDGADDWRERGADRGSDGPSHV